ncbi:energy-coupling factor transporter transmembrane component T [Candidatus Phytoplasma sacchari]|nr:energy-coupling factor transporter transmembrane component T [Candidatus Phytoplasma sacchari]KAB8122841.1 energy-coupling factor transporter transmembrane protein EcfT [Candidatus Phytoplasma sacchari]
MPKLIKNSNYKKSKSFLFSIHPALKIILSILLFKIIFTLNIDFFFHEKNKINILFSGLNFLFIITIIILSLFSIDFSFNKLIENLSNLKLFIFFSFFIYFSFEKPKEKYLNIYIFKNTFFLFLIIFILFSFFKTNKKQKRIYFLLNLIILIILPYIFFIINFKNNYLQIIFFTIKDLLQIILILIRISLILILNIIIKETTSFMEINDGLEIILKPLKKIGIPVEIFSIMLSLIFMSIPFLLSEIQKIIKSQISRGLNFYTKNIFKKIYFLLSLLIPIFVLIFQKSFILANAMETRGFVLGKKRTKLSFYKIKKSDILIMFVIILFFLYSCF